MGLVITIGGPHGTGKSTYAKAIANEFNLRYVSAGQLFRELAKDKSVSLEELGRRAAESPEIDRLIDERSAAEAAKGNVVVEGQLAAWMAKDIAQIRIYLTAPNEVRIRRIARRDHMDYEVARKQTSEREEIQRDRYKRYYGIDVADVSLYNIIIDTGDRTVDATRTELISRIHDMLQRGNRAR